MYKDDDEMKKYQRNNEKGSSVDLMHEQLSKHEYLRKTNPLLASARKPF